MRRRISYSRPRRKAPARLLALVSAWGRQAGSYSWAGLTPTQAQAAEYARVMGVEALKRQWVVVMFGKRELLAGRYPDRKLDAVLKAVA